MGETLEPRLAALMLSLTDKLQDYVFGCLNSCLTKHDRLMCGNGMVPVTPEKTAKNSKKSKKAAAVIALIRDR